jgi:hypothetical protein
MRRIDPDIDVDVDHGAGAATVEAAWWRLWNRSGLKQP